MTVEALTHYRIYIYVNDRPPHGTPQAVSLCPGRRFSSDPTVAGIDQVTCPDCRRFWDQLLAGR